MSDIIRLALPTGRIQANVFKLLNDAGISIQGGSRSYRPIISLSDFDVKILKNQSIVEMLSLGRRDIGITGADWVKEQNAQLVELLDTNMDPVTVIAAAPKEFISGLSSLNREFVVATEYPFLTADWIARKNYKAKIIKSYGTTEVFPPEDADCIVDNTATGETLKASNLRIFDQILTSSTRIYASYKALENSVKREKIDNFITVLKSVLDARDRVMIEINVSKTALEAIAAILPCMRVPTISELYDQKGFVVKAAIPQKDIPQLVPLIKANGGTDIVVTKLSNVIP